MSNKEPSDELTAPVVTTGGIIAPAARRRSMSDHVALAIATCGVGFMPIAPGTWGSAVGVGIYLLLHRLAAWWLPVGTHSTLRVSPLNFEFAFTTLLLVIVIAVSYAGIWAATRSERVLGRKDPGAVVIDEVAGQLITFLFIPFVSPAWTIVAGFLLFRAFDIWKPYPIRRLEALESGLGIMADDVLAGLYAATVLSLVMVITALA